MTFVHDGLVSVCVCVLSLNSKKHRLSTKGTLCLGFICQLTYPVKSFCFLPKMRTCPAIEMSILKPICPLVCVCLCVCDD